MTPSYGQASTSNSDLKREIERLMEIHYLRDELKSPSDQIEIMGSEVLLRVWRELPPDPSQERIECLGYQWLLTGRGQRLGQGARAVFDKFPQFDRIRLELIEYEFKHKGVDGRGALKREEIVKPYLKMVLSKRHLNEALEKPRPLKRKLNSSLQTCLETGRRFVKEKEIQL